MAAGRDPVGYAVHARSPVAGGPKTGGQVNFFILHGSPQALDKDIVPPGACTVHTDANMVLLEKTRELQALVGINVCKQVNAGKT